MTKQQNNSLGQVSIKIYLDGALGVSVVVQHHYCEIKVIELLDTDEEEDEKKN